MPLKTVYIDICELTKLQQDIMRVISEWVHKEKTPIPRSKLIAKMEGKGIGQPTTINAINGLLVKSYIRKAEIISNKTYYVMLRTL